MAAIAKHDGKKEHLKMLAAHVQFSANFMNWHRGLFEIYCLAVEERLREMKSPDLANYMRNHVMVQGQEAMWRTHVSITKATPDRGTDEAACASQPKRHPEIHSHPLMSTFRFLILRPVPYSRIPNEKNGVALVFCSWGRCAYGAAGRLILPESFSRRASF